jgi:hypothetical protein
MMYGAWLEFDPVMALFRVHSRAEMKILGFH